MNINEIYEHIDYTLLKPEARPSEIIELCETAQEMGCASVCIPSAYVREMHYLFPDLKICTVVGFPLGNNDTLVKVYEAKQAVEHGAEEIDMVINIGAVKSGAWSFVLYEIERVKKAIGDKILKVIVETCMLTEEELIEVTKVVDHSSAEYIKTSTGFNGYGATYNCVNVIKQNIEHGTKVKASGGIKNETEAWLYIMLGADRLGMSRLP